MTTPKVLIIGLDAATPRLVEKWVSEGRLPTIAKFLADGAFGPLRSVPNRNSAPAWSTMVTGTNPGKHGIFWFTEDNPETYDYKFVNGSFRRTKAFWRVLSDEGQRVGIVNVPLSFPAEDVNGVFVGGLDSPSPDDPRFTHPPELRHEVVKAAGGEYFVHPGLAKFVIAGQADEGLERLHRSIDKRAAVSKHLMANHEWDAFMVVFTETDVVQHFFWKQMEDPDPGTPEHHQTAVRDTYEHCDRVAADLIEAAGPDTLVIVVSDHGARFDDGLARAIPSWLEQLGLLAYKEEKANRNAKAVVQGAIAKTFRQLDKRLSPEAKHRLARRFPWARSRVEVMMSYAKVDWSRTLAYTDGKRPEIWINLKGRQNQGIVDPADYDKVRQQIIDAIEPALNAKTGEPLCRKVWKREDAYSGPYVERSPDLIIEWLDAGPCLDVKQADGRVFKLEKHHLPDDPFDRLLNGGHDQFGIVGLLGPGVRPGRIDGAEIADIGPTILYVRDAPIPEDVDGKVLTSALTFDRGAKQGDSAQAPPTSAGDTQYSADEEAEIHERLQALGYVE
ncbi:MAG: alkaline phosphatase family protein [Actinobacteria bacterium]|nr:alkaline phosphatase family protein [Actinomycetota bacterium]